MIKEQKYWQCSHIRKCKWIGKYEDLDSVRNTEHSDVYMTDCVCPRCGNEEFYVLSEEEYQKINNKK